MLLWLLPKTDYRDKGRGHDRRLLNSEDDLIHNLVPRFSPGTGRRLRVERKVKGPEKFVGGACLVVYS